MERLLSSSVDDGQNTFFTSAIRNKNAYICRFLLNHNASLVQQPYEGEHLLCMACTVSSEEIIVSMADLVDDETLRGIQYTNGENLLIKACQRRLFRLLRYLLIRGLDPRSKDESGRSVLEFLVRCGNAELVELLVDHYNVKADEPDSEGNPLVFRSIMANNATISELLLRTGVDPDIIDKDGVCLLEWTVKKGWYLHTSYLFRRGCKSIYRDERLFHRLCHLAMEKNSSIIFYKLMSNYMAFIIQRAWRRRVNKKLNSI